MGLQGKVAIVTGAAKGTGRLIAREMAAAGASLVITSRMRDGLAETGEMIERTGGKTLSVRADLLKARHRRRVIAQAILNFGKVDILVNNAAVTGPAKPIMNFEEDEWDAVFAVNLKGMFLFSRAVIPHMKRQGSGKIINVITGIGDILLPAFGAYSIARAGIMHLTGMLAGELKAYNIQVAGLYHDLLTRRLSPF